jgi:hypothetical protein
MARHLTVLTPEAAVREEASARAYLASMAAGFGILLSEWEGQDDGTAVYEIGSGATLTHTPTGPTPFVATIPCHHHTRHTIQVTWPHEYTDADDVTRACSRRPRDRIVRFIHAPDGVLLGEVPDDEPAATVIEGVVLATVHHADTSGRHRQEAP